MERITFCGACLQIIEKDFQDFHDNSRGLPMSSTAATGFARSLARLVLMVCLGAAEGSKASRHEDHIIHVSCNPSFRHAHETE